MGTHPIFESDFDCLTELISDLGWMRIASISPLPPDKMDKQSVLDLLEGPEEEDIPDWDQNGHFEDNSQLNGTSVEKSALSYSYDDEKNSSKGSITSNGSDERKAKRVELKSLLGNSLGSYWNDGSMMVDKRRRKQVVRYTTEDDKKENEGEEDEESIIRPKRKSTSVLIEDKNEKVNLKKRARPQKISSINPIDDIEPIKADDSYYKLFETGSVLNSTMESSFNDDQDLVGSKRRKRSKPYTTSPYSVACQIALKPVKNFNICSYKQPSLLLKECSNFLIRDHSAVPLTLALEAAELIHVSQYKALMQTKKHIKRKLPYSKSKSDLDNRRPGYSRAKEELKGFLCKVTVERNIQSQQRASGVEYQNQKRKLIEFLNNYNQQS